MSSYSARRAGASTPGSTSRRSRPTRIRRARRSQSRMLRSLSPRCTSARSPSSPPCTATASAAASAWSAMPTSWSPPTTLLRPARGRPGRARRRDPPVPSRAAAPDARHGLHRSDDHRQRTPHFGSVLHVVPADELARPQHSRSAARSPTKSPAVIRAAKQSLNGIDLWDVQPQLPLRAGLHVRAQPVGRGRRAPQRLRGRSADGRQPMTADKRADLDDVVAELRSGMTIAHRRLGHRAASRWRIVRAILRSDLDRPHDRQLGRPGSRAALRRRQGAPGRLRVLRRSTRSPLDPHFRTARQTGAIERRAVRRGAVPPRAAGRGVAGAVPAGARRARQRPLPGQRPSAHRDLAVRRPGGIRRRAGVRARRRPSATSIAPTGGATQVPRARPVLGRHDARGRADRQALRVDRADRANRRHCSVDGCVHQLRIPRMPSTASSRHPLGAHFTSCDPDYGRDEEFQREYAAERRVDPEPGPEFRAAWIDVDRGRIPSGSARRRPMTRHPRRDLRRRGRRVFRGDGEILANPIGTIPMIGGRLARATFEPDLMMTDGEAALIANDEATPARRRPGGRVLEPVPIDVRLGLVGPPSRDDGRHPGRPLRQPEHRRHRRHQQPKAQLLGYRGAPGNTINDTTSYWVPEARAKVFVERSTPSPASDGTGPRHSAPTAARFVEVRRVVTRPRRVRLRDARSLDARALGPPRCRPSTRSSRPPGSSWSSTTGSRPTAGRPTRSCASSAP